MSPLIEIRLPDEALPPPPKHIEVTIIPVPRREPETPASTIKRNRAFKWKLFGLVGLLSAFPLL